MVAGGRSKSYLCRGRNNARQSHLDRSRLRFVHNFWGVSWPNFAAANKELCPVFPLLAARPPSELCSLLHMSLIVERTTQVAWQKRASAGFGRRMSTHQVISDCHDPGPPTSIRRVKLAGTIFALFPVFLPCKLDSRDIHGHVRAQQLRPLPEAVQGSDDGAGEEVLQDLCGKKKKSNK